MVGQLWRLTFTWDAEQSQAYLPRVRELRPHSICFTYKSNPISFRFPGEMIDKLTLTFNRTRQAVITGELIEIISGAAAL